MARPDPIPVSRRSVVLGAGATAVGAGALMAGCSTVRTAPAPSAAPSAAQPAGAPVGPASDIPVGSARIYEALGLVVTQPTAGTYEGFSSTCTHQGCALNSVQADNIVCPCHGSRFALDGSVVKGPAQRPLDPRPVTVTDGEITLA